MTILKESQLLFAGTSFFLPIFSANLCSYIKPYDNFKGVSFCSQGHLFFSPFFLQINVHTHDEDHNFGFRA